MKIRTAVALAAVLAAGAVSAAGQASAAQTISVVPATPGGANTFPFGRGNVWGPYLGWVYKNLPPMRLNPGDTIAFDLNNMNDEDIRLNIGLAPTTVNGGDVPTGAFTTIVSNGQTPANPRGDLTTGNYELQFNVETPFSFPGGGLVIRTSDPAGPFASDITDSNVTSGNLATSSDPSGFFVSRWRQDADGVYPWANLEPLYVTGFRLGLNSDQFTLGAFALNKKRGTAILSADVPGPGELTLSGAGLQTFAATASGPGPVQLQALPVGKAKKKLAKKGKRSFNGTVTYAPSLNGPVTTQGGPLQLKKKLKKKKK